MSIQTAKRTLNVRRSFVREILKAAAKPEVISFAGGLPNPRFIPVTEISEAIQQILKTQGAAALQYCASEGHPLLRQWIAEQYNIAGLAVSAEQILITTGSQQGLDLLGKVLIDPGDRVVVEDPTYIAALQAFGMYEPIFAPIAVDSNGIDVQQLRQEIQSGAKLVYCMPNFQNPTGISYSASRRAEVGEVLRDTSVILIEDDPYARLRFRGVDLPPMACHRPDHTVLLGSFSKIIAPGMRLGWLCAPMELMDKLIIAKQAVDLHSENLGQWVMHRLVTDGNFDRHLQAIREAYGHQCQKMIEAIQQYLPPEIRYTRPDGGMFIWLTLPAGISSLDLFQLAIEQGVAFVPGPAFHASGDGENTMRLNFSNSDPKRIEDGIRRLAFALSKLQTSQVAR
jgi:2-aminoadipate transaminase